MLIKNKIKPTSTYTFILIMLGIICVASTSYAQSKKLDKYTLQNCQRAMQTTVRMGFRYNDHKPYGLQNSNNWGLDSHKEVTLCGNGSECGVLKSTFDKYARRANKLIYRFMANDEYALVCYVEKASKKFSGRDLSVLLCNPENEYGCFQFCDSWGGATYNCSNGREQ